jgi:sugar phosphate isomerase/epimerase
MAMQLGISSFSYTWAVGLPEFPPRQPMGLQGLLDEAVRLDVPVLQVANNLPLHLVSPEELDRFEQRARDLQIQVEVAARGIRTDHLRRYLALAARFRSPFLRAVIDSVGHEPSPDEVVALLAPLRPEFEAAGILLAFENHDRFPVCTLVEIIERLGPEWTGICLDTANCLGALEGPRVAVETLAPYTVNLHLKDLVIYRTIHTMSYIIEGRPVGQGMVDISWALDEVRRYGRDMSVILEMWTPPEDDLEVTIAKERRWVEESAAYLRKLL